VAKTFFVYRNVRPICVKTPDFSAPEGRLTFTALLGKMPAYAVASASLADVRLREFYGGSIHILLMVLLRAGWAILKKQGVYSSIYGLWQRAVL
jgi:hypothetical protein